MKVAIYSRKSVFTGKGESIENQIEMCKEYFSRLNQNNVEYFIYEDEGFSGGNINRPRFQQLLKDIKKNSFDALICYRLDRISRNVADFSTTLELLQEHNVDFISIREQFDTSTPMGRAMVYIASVFAQLERETIAERIRDNMLQLSKTGRWLGGVCPLGFTSEKITYVDSEYNERSMFKLSPLEEEMNVVRFIFSKYLATSSIHMALKELLASNIKGKHGGDFASMSLADILKNPVYVQSDSSIKEYYESLGVNFFGEPNGCGIMLYNKKNSKGKLRDMSEWIAAVGKHKGIISSSDWLKVQYSLDRNSKKNNPRQGTSAKALLSGVLKCSICGAPMRVCYGRLRKDGKRNHYYMCTMKAHSCKSRCQNPNAKGLELEQEVINRLINYNEETLLRKLTSYADKLKSSTPNDMIKNIDKSIDEKKSEMDTLMSQLGKTNNPATQNFILKKADSLSNEIMDLENKLNGIHKKKEQNSIEMRNIEIIMSSFSEFTKLCSTIKDVSNIEDENIKIALRNLINRLVSRISYNGFTKEVVIDIMGSQENCSPSG